MSQEELQAAIDNIQDFHTQMRLVLINGAVEMNLSDIIGDGKVSLKEITQKLESNDENRVYRYLKSLAALNYYKEVEPKVFTCLPHGKVLRRSHPFSTWAVQGQMKDAANFGYAGVKPEI